MERPDESRTGLAWPLDLFPGRAGPLSAEQIQRWMWFLIALGILARAFRYALRFPLWGDESYLSASLLDRGFLDLTRPLEYHQVCPLLYLWVQRALVKLLGFSEYTLRLWGFACSIASLLLFRWLARCVLRGTALLMAVGIFAVGYPGIRYAAEAKPYECDLAVALVLLTCAVRWWRRPESDRWLWVLAAVLPLALGLSYPAVFVGGGIVAAVAVELRMSGSRHGWTAWAVAALSLAASFAGVYALCAGAQLSADLGNMAMYWSASFPPAGSPGALLGWLLSVHTGELLAYPVGGPRGGSLLTLVCCVVAIVVLCRKRQAGLLVLCLGPFFLNFCAALVHRYPYGGSVRLGLFLAPLVCLLTGVGIDAIFAGLLRRRGPGAPAELLIVPLLAAIAVGSMVRDCRLPGKSESDIRARDFARWFWYEMARDGELVCCKTDLQEKFASRVFEYGFSAQYLCNQRIYSARHARRQPPQWDRISERWPLRCVRYRSSLYPEPPEAISQWLGRMQARYRLVGRREYPLTHYRNQEREVDDVGTVDVYEFIPRAAAEKK
jgi:hypothetical protein